MDKIISNPGLWHLAENVFWNLDLENLKICAHINQSCKQILQNPIFCVRKFECLSKSNQTDWIKAIQLVKNSDKGIAIISYLQWNLKKDALADLPCYKSPVVQDNFRKKIGEICCSKGRLSDEDMEILKILAPLTDNPNATNTDNPNAQNDFGDTPIHRAAVNGHTEIVKIMAPLTDNPNAPNNVGDTPIFRAAIHGHTNIVKFLAPLTDNPNSPDDGYGPTPLDIAEIKGHKKIVKILAHHRHHQIQ